MKKVRVKKMYFDKVLDTYKEKVGEEFDVEDERADVLVKAGVCELVEEGQDGDDDAGQLPPATTSEDDGAKANPKDDEKSAEEDESVDEETSSEESTEDETSEEGSETSEEPKKQTRGRRTSNK